MGNPYWMVAILGLPHEGQRFGFLLNSKYLPSDILECLVGFEF
jgi:hypothetical protein